jgi:chromosome segregation ATPase
MSKAIANLDDLKRLQGSVRKTEEQITQAIKQLHRELDRADWDDHAKRNFESKLKDATSSVQRASQRLHELQPILQRSINDLNTYLRRS